MSRYPARLPSLPNPRPLSRVLSTPLVAAGLQHLQVLQHPSYALHPALAQHRPRVLPAILETELTAITGSGFQRPCTELPALTRLHGFYAALARVMATPASVPDILRDGPVRDRAVVSRRDGFVSGEGLGLSSSPPGSGSARSRV